MYACEIDATLIACVILGGKMFAWRNGSDKIKFILFLFRSRLLLTFQPSFMYAVLPIFI